MSNSETLTTEYTIRDLHAASISTLIMRSLPSTEINSAMRDAVQEALAQLPASFIQRISGIHKSVWCYSYEKLITTCSTYGLLQALYTNYGDVVLNADPAQKPPIIILYDEKQKHIILGAAKLSY